MIYIPKIIHFVWIGPRKIPEKYKENIQSYKLNNPDWTVKLWNNKNLPNIKNKFVYNKMTSWAARTDVLRLEILYQFGGIYTDIDSICYRKLDSLVDNLTCFGMCGNDGKVANGTLGCTKGNYVFKILVDKLEGHVYMLKQLKRNKKRGSHVLGIAGEGYITPILKSNKTFTMIDDDKNKGTRKLIITSHEKITEECYIYHELARSWINEGKERIKL